jgi:hypothetical protein
LAVAAEEVAIDAVMAGLVPAIHVFLLLRPTEKNVDARDKPGHDEILEPDDTNKTRGNPPDGV